MLPLEKQQYSSICRYVRGNIPCHRVVNAKGEVAEHFAFGGAKGQREMLEKEGSGREGRNFEISELEF